MVIVAALIPHELYHWIKNSVPIFVLDSHVVYNVLEPCTSSCTYIIHFAGSSQDHLSIKLCRYKTT